MFLIQILYLRFSPPSEHSYRSFSSNDSTKSLRLDLSKASQSCASVYISNGSRFILNVPENNTGSCKIIYNYFQATFCFHFHIADLWYDCKLLPQVMQTNMFDAYVINQNVALLDLKQPEEAESYRRLTRSSSSHNSNLFNKIIQDAICLTYLLDWYFFIGFYCAVDVLECIVQIVSVSNWIVDKIDSAWFRPISIWLNATISPCSLSNYFS